MKGTKYWTAYRLYFGMDIGDQDKSWAPYVICGSCRSNLEGWLRGSGRVMSFAVPRVWKEPQNHHDDCYFCMINISKYRKVRGRAMTYPSILSSIALVPHRDALPVSNQPSNVSNFLWVSVTNSNLYVLRPDPIFCYAGLLVLYHFRQKRT